jgi:signal peptidase I
MGKQGRRSAVQILVMLGVGFTARASLADHYQVPTGSMEPTVQVGDRIAVSKLAYGLRVPLTHVQIASFGQPARGDVVVLESPESGMVLLKRVVAVGGDRVSVTDGALSINGIAQPTSDDGRGHLEESLDRKTHALGSLGGTELEDTIVPPDHVLVMGDNRGNSHDGRDFGFVRNDLILGRAIGVFARHGSFAWQSL